MIRYSYHSSVYREGEQFVPAHGFGIIVSGSVSLDDGNKKILIEEGELFMIRKNHLLKFVKYPSEKGKMESLSVTFDEEFLHDFSSEYGYKAEKKTKSEAFIKLSQSQELLAFLHSLSAYQSLLNNNMDALLSLKQKEALILLLQYDISLKDVLFDFSKPNKKDLTVFMNENFHFNVRLDKFAYLTGRSLATFKRDFQKTFNASPRNWLQQRRLEQAYYLITQKGKTTSEIYLDLGFENLSHFSFVFKKQFGFSPSVLQQNSLRKL